MRKRNRIAVPSDHLRKPVERANTEPAHSSDYGAYLSAPSFWKPQYLESSAWLEHAPFAFWITNVLRPRSIVELGTHSGFSFFAFCQAAQATGLETRCFAVDTWKGDEHAGFYGEDVFEHVNRYNNLHYSAFSSLVRSTFDEALPHFFDSSVDMLHIDGRHHYDDVKHDFESWVPKLSERAVVLFHNTNVRERGFGVFRFWSELANRFPNFEFFHGHGLGVLGYGANLPAEVISLCANSTHRDAAVAIRAAYSRLGGSVRSDLEGSVATARLEKSTMVANSLRIELENRTSEAVKLGNEWKVLNDENAKLKSRSELLETDLVLHNQQRVALEGQVAERDAQIGNLSQAIAESERRIQAVVYDNARVVIDKERELHALQLVLTKILRSRSWRATAPFRNIMTSWSRALSVGRNLRKFFGVRRELILRSGTRRIRASSLFDSDYYLATYPDVRAAQTDPATHYFIYGWKEHRNPSALFNTARYLSDNPDVAEAGLNPLIHYLKHGQNEGRPLPLISNPHENIPDAATINGEVEAIRKSDLFDEAFYLSMYQDLQPPPLDPIRHYCEQGWREGRNPSDDFDTQFYLATYSDIRNAGLNPFWHYVSAGATERRHALPDSSGRYEDDIRFGAVETDIKLLTFYTSHNWPAVRRGRPMFKGHSQPMLPSDELGCYDSLDWQVLKRQAEMATRHGVHGFCFDMDIAPDGTMKRQPIERFLAHDRIDIRFCAQVAISSEDLLEPIAEALGRVFADRRQIHVEDRPVLLVKVAEGWQVASTFLAQLRQLLAKQCIEAPFVIGRWVAPGDGGAILADSFDALLDLPSIPISGETGQFNPMDKDGVDAVPYGIVASNGVARIEKWHSYRSPVYHAITLGRDNTVQESRRPLVYTRFHIRDYRRWLDAAMASTRALHRDDRRFVFVNAWNAWDEGLYLEPDKKSGFSRLNETTRALLNVESGLRMPKVSVIVPNYNHEPFLRRRLETIYGQTYKNFEVLLLDDCSSDQSRSVLNEYAAAHSEITRTIYNDQNSGSAFRQWAKGLKEATGELVWIAESDDFCDERLVEVLIRCFDDEAVLLAYGNSVFVDREEAPLDPSDAFEGHVKDLNCGDKWTGPYVETARNEVISALGVKNTIPNASSVVFKRPVDMPLLDDESWLSMRAAGDWVFYLHVLRGGKIAYRPDAINFFRRYKGSAAELTYKRETFYREVGFASRTVAALYDVPSKVLERCRDSCKALYFWLLATGNGEEFARWYNYEEVLRAREGRLPNIMVSTMGFYPGGAEILPIRMANELKRQGHSVLLFSAGLSPREDGVRRMLRRDIPVIETSDVEGMRKIIHEFGIEALNSHQWHIQKYPVEVSDVFDGLYTHVASLHGMIEHGTAFEVTEEQLRTADRNVTTWVYTAEKNLDPFFKFQLCDKSSRRFVKISNGMQPPDIVPIPRSRMNIPQEAFVLCCVSRAIPDKGWAETIAAVEAARRLSGRDIRLILVGNGPVYDEYCRGGAPDFVYLAGFNENSVGHYAAADMGIMLTKFKSESFPLTIVDCLFAGKPYIASDVGDIRNMLTVGNDVAGSLIELDDWEIPVGKAAQDIAAFASDQQKYLNASTVVESAASRYRIDAVVSQYVKLFEAGRHNPRLGERAIRG
jgi:glycosyltransferase involved in cell wall biosynthesis